MVHFFSHLVFPLKKVISLSASIFIDSDSTGSVYKFYIEGQDLMSVTQEIVILNFGILRILLLFSLIDFQGFLCFSLTCQ